MAEERKHLTFYYIAQYYSPEPYLKDHQFTKDLQRELDVEVEVITSFPSYPYGRIYEGYKNSRISKERLEDIRITRLFTFAYHGRSILKRTLNYFVFAFATSLYVLFKGKSNCTYYIQQSSPFVGMVALVVRLLKRKSIIILDVQDVFPENIQASGFVKNSTILSILSVIIKRYYLLFDGIVCVSDAVTSAIRDKLDGRRIVVRTVFNWFISEGEIRSSKDDEFNLVEDNRLKIVYAGNIGIHQSLESLSKGVGIVTENLNVSFHFIGSGTSLNELSQSLESNSNVHFYGRVSPGQAYLSMLQSYILFLHLKRSVGYDRIIPSKLQAYLYCDKPILAGVSGEAAVHIENSEVGKIFEPENVQEFIDSTKALVDDFGAYLNVSGREYYKNHFSRAKGINKIVNLVHELGDI